MKDKKKQIIEEDFEKWEIKERKRIEREESPLSNPIVRAIIERRKKQAEALWLMAKRGELHHQVLDIPTRGGGVYHREVLFSHKSIYAV